MPRYTRYQVKEEFDAWCRGNIGTHTMSKKDYNAMKRRTHRHGFKKQAHHFKASQKLPRAEFMASRRRYQRQYQARRKARRKAYRHMINAQHANGMALLRLNRDETRQQHTRRKKEAQRHADEATIAYEQVIVQS
jgi:hypothetical protein